MDITLQGYSDSEEGKADYFGNLIEYPYSEMAQTRLAFKRNKTLHDYFLGRKFDVPSICRKF